jgi:hypothetical protein
MSIDLKEKKTWLYQKFYENWAWDMKKINTGSMAVGTGEEQSAIRAAVKENW